MLLFAKFTVLSKNFLFLKPNLIDSINLRIAHSSILIFFLQFKKFQDALTEHELIIGVLLYKLQLGITHNVHLIYRLSGDMSGGIPLVQTGSAVYHNCVLFNHSCAPNTTRFFQVSSNPWEYWTIRLFQVKADLKMSKCKASKKYSEKCSEKALKKSSEKLL